MLADFRRRGTLPRIWITVLSDIMAMCQKQSGPESKHQHVSRGGAAVFECCDVGFALAARNLHVAVDNTHHPLQGLHTDWCVSKQAIKTSIRISANAKTLIQSRPHLES
eukprot:296271-Rhodomonas_salina.2